MAISTPTTILASGDAANQQVYQTAVSVLTSGRLYVLVTNGYRSGGADTVSTVVHDPTGSATNFAIINDGTNNARVTGWDTGAIRSLEAWYVIPASTTASALIEISWATGSQSACGWRLYEIVSGFNAGGGSATWRQVVNNSGTSSTAIAATMAAFGATDNMTLLNMGWGTGASNPSETISPTESRTELGEHNDGERGSQGVHYQNPNGSDTSIGATLSGTQDWAAIGTELVAAAGATTVTPSPVTAAWSVQQAVIVGGGGFPLIFRRMRGR